MLLSFAFSMLISAGASEGASCRVDADCAGGLICGASDLTCHSIRRENPPPQEEEEEAPAPRARRHRHLERVDWREGDPVPPGAHVVQRPSIGLIVGGAVMLGLGWLLDWAITFPACSNCNSLQEPMSLVPIVGPFVQAGVGLGNANHDSALFLAAPFLILNGFMQAGGLAMVIVGAVVGHKGLAYDAPGFQGMILPTPMPGGGMGLSTVAHF